VDRKGEPTGRVPDPDKLQREVSSWISQCYPAISGFEAHALIVRGKHVVAVVVPESRDRPHFTGAAFVRDGSVTREANEKQFDQLIEDRNDLVWELRPYEGRPITLVREIQRAGARLWEGPEDGWTLVAVNRHYLTARFAERGESFSLRRVYLERDIRNDRPLLRVSLG
jgi:hypothetical protein